MQTTPSPSDNHLLQHASLATPLFTLRDRTFVAKCVKCYDADSIHVVILLNGVLTRFRCRLLGIDTPEIRAKDPAERRHARAARDYLREHIHSALVRIVCGDFDKYGRLLVWVHPFTTTYDTKTTLTPSYHNIGGNSSSYVNSWNERLVTRGYAYPYDGGKKTPYSEWATKADVSSP